jgi:hypothetical protein
MSGTIIARWRDWSGDGIQHLALRVMPDQIVAEAAVLTATDDSPFAARLRIACDRRWRVRTVEVHMVGDDRQTALSSDGQGHWRDHAGKLLAHLDGAIDVDLPLTPFTNTLPIRRLDLREGQSADLIVVYIRLPEFEIVTDPQRYTCLEFGRRYRYESLDSDFEREIDVDEDGLVVTYPGLFRQVFKGKS